MLSTEEFGAWSKKVVLFLHNTSRCKDEPYPNLLFEKGGNGFPTVSFLGADGRLLTQVGHITPVEQLEAAWQKLEAYEALRKSAAKDSTRLKELVTMQLEHGYVTFAEAEVAVAKVDWSEAEKATVREQMVNLEFRDILRSTPRDDMASGGALCYAMLERDRVPTSSQLTSFWQYMFAYAGEQRDVAMFERLLQEARRRHPDDKRLGRYLPQLERQLEQLRKAAGK